MTELQSKLQELRELIEAKTVECPRCHGAGTLPSSRPHLSFPCNECDATGHISDPAIEALKEKAK